MAITVEQFESWLIQKENENLEFKEAKDSYSIEKLEKYCNAISNERGGYLILGVNDKFPHEVCGTKAFQNIESLKFKLFEKLKIRINIQELIYNNKRVLIFEIQSRSIGSPLLLNGAAYMRVWDSLVPMSTDQLKKIFNETQPDFSSEVCSSAKLSDLSDVAIGELRLLLYKKSNNKHVLDLNNEQLLYDTELMVDGKINNAAIILLGKHETIGKFLPNSEIVFEYRDDENTIQTLQRKDFKEGFLLIYNKLWELINFRNNVEHIQEGLFIREIPNFNEEVIREALLNAVCHRDYNLQSSIFIRQYPKLLEIESPGGFPPGITPQNIIDKQYPRNRRIAEVFQKCGLVERSGQGVDKIFRISIAEAKQQPDFSKSDDFAVLLRIKGEVQDINFLKFVEKVKSEKNINLSTRDLILLDEIRIGNIPKNEFQSILKKMIENGIIEKFGRGRGSKYILSKKYYVYIGQPGIYTRIKGLDKDEKKELILKHLKFNDGKGTIQHFEQVISSYSRNQIHQLLKELKKESKIKRVGNRKDGHWELLD